MAKTDITYEPTNATPKLTDIVVESSESTILVRDENPNAFKALKPGVAELLVKEAASGSTVSCTVTVIEPKTDDSLAERADENANVHVTPGQETEQEATAKIAPSKAETKRK